MKFLAIVLTLVLFASLSGCSKHQQIKKDIQAYSERLQSFTNIPVKEVESASSKIMQLPNKASLSYDIAPLNINLREFHAFNACSLNTLVAERNTSLGKMQLPSGRFVYESALLAEFDKCENLLKGDTKNTSLVEKLSAYKTLKLKQYPKVWSNFITSSEEIKLHISLANDYIAGNANDNFYPAKQAWHYLANTYQPKQVTQNNVDATSLENHLRTLEQSRLLARIFRTQKLISSELDVMSAILEKFLSNNKCATKQQEDDIIIMRNIFTLFFAQKIQSVAAELNKYVYQIRPILDPLISNSVLPPAYTEFFTQHLVVEHKEYKKSMKNHITLWQRIFARCD